MHGDEVETFEEISNDAIKYFSELYSKDGLNHPYIQN